MRIPVAGPLVAVLVAVIPATRDGMAKVSLKRLPEMSVQGSFPSVAVGLDGAPHILYPSPEDRLRHAWLEAGRWRDEPVESRWAFCESGSLKVDSAGRLHAVYSVYPDESSGYPGEIKPSVLVYGVRDSNGWTLSEVTGVGPAYGSAVIAIGSGDVPRILFVGAAEGGLVLAVRDGDSWSSTDTDLSTGTSSRQSDLALDDDGHAHILFTFDGQLLYATDASGAWQETVLEDSPSLLGDLALDAGGHPHILVGTGDIFHLWDDGGGWQSEQILPSVEPGRARYVGGLAADDAGHLFVAFSESRYVHGHPVPFAGVAYFDGVRWREAESGIGNLGVVTSAARGPDGAFHVAGGGFWLRHLRLALPDLRADGDDLSVVPEGSDLRVSGPLRVRNAGPGKSKATRLALYLSDDDQLDEGDEFVGFGRSLGGIRPGRDREIPISLEVPGTATGRFLLAVVDPQGLRHDIDRPNNTAAVFVGE